MSIEVGDRVRVVYRKTDYYDEKGKVIEEGNFLLDFRVRLNGEGQPTLGFNEDELQLLNKNNNSTTMMRIIAYKNKKMTSIWELIEERQCDPNPGQYSLWNTGNGALHSELRGYDIRLKLVEDAREEGFNVIKIFNQNDPKRY